MPRVSECAERKENVAVPETTATTMQWSDAKKAQVIGWVEKYAKVLKLDDYEINVTFHDKPDEDDANATASTSGNYPYKLGNCVSIHPRFAELNEEQQEARIPHELLHIVLTPQYRLLWKVLVKEQFVTWREAKEINEFVTDHLSVVVMDLLTGASTEAGSSGVGV